MTQSLARIKVTGLSRNWQLHPVLVMVEDINAFIGETLWLFTSAGWTCGTAAKKCDVAGLIVHG